MPATLYIFSDGNFEHVTGFSLGNLSPIYVPIGQDDSPNVGILAFSVREPRNPGGPTPGLRPARELRQRSRSAPPPTCGSTTG